jgi:AbrB family looped-hinge helix DNA binding protein
MRTKGDITMPPSATQAEVQLGARGRLVVPARLRKTLGFEPGDVLVARVEDGRLVIEKTESVKRRLHARFDQLKGRSLADELIAERRNTTR